MRKLKIQVQTTVDGYMAGPDGEMDWLTFAWSEDLLAHVAALTAPVDCIVLGRRLAEGFIPTWAAGPEGETQAAIDKMNHTPKVVVTRTLTESPWDGTVVADDLVDTVTKLKEAPGRDIIAYGGGKLVQSLIAARLVDELHLFVNPTAIGAGIPVFASEGGSQRFELVAARQFDCGITGLHLEPSRA